MLYFRITITTKGKYTALESDVIPPLVELVDDPYSEVRLNALKVSIIRVAEHTYSTHRV